MMNGTPPAGFQILQQTLRGLKREIIDDALAEIARRQSGTFTASGQVSGAAIGGTIPESALPAGISSQIVMTMPNVSGTDAAQWDLVALFDPPTQGKGFIRDIFGNLVASSNGDWNWIFGVCLEAIPDGESGRVCIQGVVDHVTLDAPIATWGYLRASTTPGSGTGNQFYGGGVIGVLLGTGASPPVYLLGFDQTIGTVALTAWSQGDMVYFDGTSWTTVPVGTAGQVLTLVGSPPVPTWV